MDMAIFFDFDGTLVNVADRFYAVYQTVCQMLSLSALPKADYWQCRQRRLTTREILALTRGETAYDAFIAERSRLIEDPEYLRLNTLRDGAIDILRYLTNRCEVHLVSLRNSRTNLLWELEILGIRNYFTSVSTASAFGTFEDKARLLLAANAQPQRDLIVGDTEIDIQAGQRQGLRTCAVLNGMRTETALRRLRPDYLISDLSELILIVDQLVPAGSGG